MRHSCATPLLEAGTDLRTIQEAESDKPAESELKIEFDLPAAVSQWFGRPRSSPAYVDGESFQGPDCMIEKRLKVLDHIARRLKDRRFIAAFAGREVEALTSQARKLNR